ncbi:MAG: 4-hydroxy-3-methylbut-2-en-1-yl diphosphate synthase [Porphyromonadaceae bacterium CG2_30_38_12]|nr:MAG: 4-hydroxy-3-methylbut-2-en-1-yl diphosphate synthase [Porphyromonadaceae bacterium CG2_30_38_12]
MNPFKYNRRPSQEVEIGNLLLGGTHPVRVQSMANTDTNDIENSVAQCERIVAAGADLVRFTTQGVREAESAKLIHNTIREIGLTTPLVADIHFNANAADVAARHVEKVRINPGNYVGSVKIGDSSDYTDEEFEKEYQKIRARFIPFLDICKANNTAIRIGVNHGSLSERMMNRFGDTPQGMVASCMEFLEICREQNFHNIVISMKTSNTVMMVHVVRLLVDEMEKKDMHYPLHLGVTEAGDGEDGRIKSSVGIGTLLLDGIGDTIRVSLSEEPEAEVPVARMLVEYTELRKNGTEINIVPSQKFSQFEYQKRETNTVGLIGGDNVPVVIAHKDGGFATLPDFLLVDNAVKNTNGDVYPIFNTAQVNDIIDSSAPVNFLRMCYSELNSDFIQLMKSQPNLVVLLDACYVNSVSEMRAFFHTLLDADCHTPVILSKTYREKNLQDLQIKAAADLGALFVDGFGDGIFLQNTGDITVEQITSVAFGILQASRVRTTKTEYISCPSCGRTMFNLQTVIARIKARTSHLKGLKIGIMGCIVNGPGEMADADYGYVGAGRGKISLYKKKECVERNIPEENAVDKLIDLIKVHGDWHD